MRARTRSDSAFVGCRGPLSPAVSSRLLSMRRLLRSERSSIRLLAAVQVRRLRDSLDAALSFHDHSHVHCHKSLCHSPGQTQRTINLPGGVPLCNNYESINIILVCFTQSRKHKSSVGPRLGRGSARRVARCITEPLYHRAHIRVMPLTRTDPEKRSGQPLPISMPGYELAETFKPRP